MEASRLTSNQVIETSFCHLSTNMIRVHASEQSSPWWGADGLHIVLLQADPLSAQVVNVGCMHIWVAVSHIHPTYKYYMLNWTKKMLMENIYPNRLPRQKLCWVASHSNHVPGQEERHRNYKRKKIIRTKNNEKRNQFPSPGLKIYCSHLAPTRERSAARHVSRTLEAVSMVSGWPGGRAFTVELGWGVFSFILSLKHQVYLKANTPSVTPHPHPEPSCLVANHYARPFHVAMPEKGALRKQKKYSSQVFFRE